jgi:hypothetical protein
MSVPSIDTTCPPRAAIFFSALQPLGLRGRQRQDLLAPTPHAGLGDPIARGQVGDALIVAQRGHHNQRGRLGRQGAPARADLLQAPTRQVTDVAQSARGQRQAALVGKGIRVVPSVIGFFTKYSTTLGEQTRSRPGTHQAVMAHASRNSLDLVLDVMARARHILKSARSGATDDGEVIAMAKNVGAGIRRPSHWSDDDIAVMNNAVGKRT